MKIRVQDIPVGGRDFDFDLDVGNVNSRINAVRDKGSDDKRRAPSYSFRNQPRALMNLTVEGSTVYIDGRVSADYATSCSRCAEETERRIDAPVKLVLKPLGSGKRPEERDEDLYFGFYKDDEIDCTDIAEEFLMLAVPYTELCSEECKGLCPAFDAE